MAASEASKFQHWAIVEVMGHQTFAGYVTEEAIAGKGFVRIDVPEVPTQAAFTRYCGPDSIYGIQPVSEELARAIAVRLNRAPVSVYVPELYPPQEPKALPHGEDEPDAFRPDDPFQDD